MDRTKKLRIKRGNVAIMPNPDEAHIRMSVWGIVYVVSDDEKTGTVAKTVSLLDGNHAIDEIIESVGRDAEVGVLSIIESLLAYNVLEEVRDEPVAHLTSDEVERYQPMISYFSLAPIALSQSTEMQATAESTVAALKGAKIMVIGARMVGSRVAIQLAQLGVGEICIVDDKMVTEEDTALIPFLTEKEKDTGPARSEVVASLARNANPYVRVYTVPEDHFENELGKYTLVIVAGDRPSPLLYKRIKTVALDKKVMWTMVTMDGVEGIIGPTIVPHETACYTCYEMRLECNIDAYTEYLQYKKYLDEHPETYAETIGIPPFADIIAGFLVSDVPIMLQTSGVTFGRQVIINFPAQKIEVNNVLKLPRCPSCGKAAREKPSYQIYRTLTSVMEEFK